jgi:hypothetical protein
LVKIRDEKATAVVIAPAWKGMIWTALIRAMTLRKTMIGPSDVVLEMGPQMRRSGAKLPPGKLEAVLVNG